MTIAHAHQLGELCLIYLTKTMEHPVLVLITT